MREINGLLFHSLQMLNAFFFTLRKLIPAQLKRRSLELLLFVVVLNTRLTDRLSQAVSFPPLRDGIQVSSADMLSEVSAPHGDTHHHNHHLPLLPP